MRFSPIRRTRLVAIRNFDEELYKLVKAYASLEGRTIASIIEEALRYWMRSRSDYEEVRAWVRLERLYEENLRALREEVNREPDKYRDGYALACDGRFLGAFGSYDEAIRSLRSACKGYGLIIKLPYKEEVETIELGLPW